MNIHTMSIKEIKTWLDQQQEISEEIIKALEADHRQGVKSILNSLYHKIKEKNAHLERWIAMSQYEKELWKEGYQYIAGVDEVGRGPLAGPVVAAAVILPSDFYLPGLNDSKKIKQEERESFYEHIQKHAIATSVGIISADVIDKINILNATKLAMKQAIQNLSVKPQYLLIDALTLDLDLPQSGIIGGDGKSISIAAASIVAKVTRDRLMQSLSLKYPQYAFDRNMGYGTKEHLQAIQEYGITPIHRKTFAGVKEWVMEEKVGS